MVISNVAVLILLFILTWKGDEYEATQDEDTEEAGRKKEREEEDTTTDASHTYDTEEVNKTWKFTDFWIYS